MGSGSIDHEELKECLAYIIQKYCFSIRNLKCSHGQVICHGLQHNLYIASILINRYFQFGDSKNARLVLDSQKGIQTKTLIWNALIKGYIRIGWPGLALETYKEMIGPSINCEPDKNTLHHAITACTQLADFKFGRIVGSHARRRGLESDLIVGTTLIDMYSKAGDISAARQVFDRMSSRDIVTWNIMISGYILSGLLPEAIELLNHMRSAHQILPTEATMVILNSYCGHCRDIKNGEALHAYATKVHLVVGSFVNSLMEMYLKCDNLDVALELFSTMVGKDAVSWSTMIGGYVRHKKPYEALKLFQLMIQTTNILPTRPLLLNVIAACADTGDWEEAKNIEQYLMGFISDPSVVTACLYMYAKCGKIEISLHLLDRVEKVRRDVMAWNILAKACLETGHSYMVLKLTVQMQRKGMYLDHVSIIILLSTISSNPLLKKVTETHAQIIKRGFEMDRHVANSLLDLYAKVGSCMELNKVFEGILEKDVVSWTIMIKAYGWNKKPDEVLNLLEQMKNSGIEPNCYTFLSLLSACSHAGLVEKGCELFRCMKEQYGLDAGIEHFACMLDMLCRAEKFDDACCFLEKVIEMGYNHATLWSALLSSYRLQTNVKMGEASARHLFQMEPNNVANYIMLADINISAGRRENANYILSLSKAKGLEKLSGCSWILGGH